MKERLAFVVFVVALVLSLYLAIFYIFTLTYTPISGFAVSTKTEEKLFKFETNSDILELREALGDVYSALTQKELPELLKSGKVTSNKGSTDYNQYLRFDDTTSLQKVNVNFTENGEGVKDYLQILAGNNITDAIFEYQLEFEEGFESDIKSNKLEDIEDEELNILGRIFSVTSTNIDTNIKKVQLTMLSAPVVEIMKENEKKIFTIDGKQYTVEVSVISDSDVKQEVQLKINDEATNNLETGETYTLKDGTKLGVDDILTSEATSDQVKILLAAEKIYLEDNYNDDSFSQGLKINDKTISNGYLQIKSTSTSSEFSMSSIKYRAISNKDLYLSESESLASNLNQESLLTGSWDIKYNGLEDVPSNELKIEASGNTKLKLHFTNSKDQVYVVPFVSRETTSSFKLGDSTKSLVFIEGSNRTDFNIQQQDYFVVTSKNDRTGETNILKYNSIDTSNKILTFDDLVTGSKTTIYTENITGIQQGTATLEVGGTSYILFISNDTSPKIVIDQNADGTINSGEAKIIIKGGGILDIGSTNNITDNFTVSLTTESNRFDERTSDEVISFTIEKRPSTVGISSTFSGIKMYSSSDHTYGMSDYGALFDFMDESGNDADTLKIDYPEEQKAAEVFIIYREPKAEVVQETIQEPPQEEIKQELKPPVQEKPQPIPQQEITQPAQKQREQKWTKYLIILGIVLAVILILILIFSLFRNKPKPKRTNQTNYFAEKVSNTRNTLSEFIKDHLSQGYTKEQVKKYLHNLGYLEKQIEDAFSKLK